MTQRRSACVADESRCVDCQRCVSFCPTRALKIVKSDYTFRENANWQADTIREIYKQAASGGVLLSSMGNAEGAAGVLGPDADQRLAGDEPAD